MSEPVEHGSGPVGDLEPGQQPAGAGTWGVSVQDLGSVVLLIVIARKGKAHELGNRIAGFLGSKTALGPGQGSGKNDLFICAIGPVEYCVLSAKCMNSGIIQTVEKMVGDCASVFDHSDGRLLLGIHGPHAADLLGKGTSLDLEGRSLPASGAAYTIIEQIPALVIRGMSPDGYHVSVPRSYTASFMTWLTEAAHEYDYEIDYSQS